MLAVTNTLITRAVLIPSEAYFTAAVGVLPSVSTVLATYVILIRPESATPGLPPALPTAIMGLWCATALVVSAVTSRVIYGLRREVREAKSLGQYTLEERIGEGGMGVVYKARHAMLRRPTAIKLLRADLAGERSIARFEREVQLTSRLTHPNTILIYDYGRTPDGTFYYAMEYLPGITLEELVRQDGPQPVGRVIHILTQVCASLAEAHGIGLIHRDIKGANVLLSVRGGIHDVVKVVDFGLVKDIENISDATLSGAQTITGTPLYLSPEAIRTPDKVDARSDLYSLGVLGYHLVTGKQLFESENFVEICSHHLHSQPIPPSARVARAIPKDIEGLILMCLEKEPSRRPKDASSLLKALEACAGSGDWSEEEARTWWRRFEKSKKDGGSELERTAVAARSPTVPIGLVQTTALKQGD
jgi:serine/threonine-protein kinase